jgi:hypothetical protein
MGGDGADKQPRGNGGRQTRQQPACRLRNAIGEQIVAGPVTCFSQDAGGVLIRQGVAEHGEKPLRLSFIQHLTGWGGVVMADARSVEDPAGRLIAKQRRERLTRLDQAVRPDAGAVAV